MILRIHLLLFLLCIHFDYDFYHYAIVLLWDVRSNTTGDGVNVNTHRGYLRGHQPSISDRWFWCVGAPNTWGSTTKTQQRGLDPASKETCLYWQPSDSNWISSPFFFVSLPFKLGPVADKTIQVWRVSLVVFQSTICVGEIWPDDYVTMFYSMSTVVQHLTAVMINYPMMLTTCLDLRLKNPRSLSKTKHEQA